MTQNVVQYVAVKFRPEDVREYTYHNTGAPLNVGDEVLAPVRGKDMRVTVSNLPLMKPPFATKEVKIAHPKEGEAL